MGFGKGCISGRSFGSAGKIWLLRHRHHSYYQRICVQKHDIPYAPLIHDCPDHAKSDHFQRIGRRILHSLRDIQKEDRKLCFMYFILYGYIQRKGRCIKCLCMHDYTRDWRARSLVDCLHVSQGVAIQLNNLVMNSFSSSRKTLTFTDGLTLSPVVLTRVGGALLPSSSCYMWADEMFRTCITTPLID